MLEDLPPDGTLPFLDGWKWIAAPGHSPGQIALFREADALLISADAIITVRQDSLYKVLGQKEEICGPPVYLTTDWTAARKTFEKLAALKPQILVPGHGTAMHGTALEAGLNHLLQNWEEEAVPDHGKWVSTRKN